MGISNRDYYKDTPSSCGSWGSHGLTPAVKFILIANIAVFLLQLFITRDSKTSQLDIMRRHNPKIDRLVSEAEKDPAARQALEKKHPEIARLMDEDGEENLFAGTPKVSIVQEWLQLDTKKVVYGGQVWRLLTHAFCHDRYAILHIVFNMFFLIWFGCTLESMYGTREFLLFYLTAAVVAALTFVAMDLYMGSSVPAVGASGAVMGVVMLYVMHFPRETVCMFWTQIELRWLVLLYILWDLHPTLLALTGDPMFTGVAHAAHLGGLAFGFLYARSSWRLSDVLDRLPGFRPHRASAKQSHPRLSATDSQQSTDTTMSRVDELLAKISISGPESLTDEERAILMQASDRIKKRSRC